MHCKNWKHENVAQTRIILVGWSNLWIFDSLPVKLPMKLFVKVQGGCWGIVWVFDFIFWSKSPNKHPFVFKKTKKDGTVKVTNFQRPRFNQKSSKNILTIRIWCFPIQINSQQAGLCYGFWIIYCRWFTLESTILYLSILVHLIHSNARKNPLMVEFKANKTLCSSQLKNTMSVSVRSLEIFSFKFLFQSSFWISYFLVFS